MRLFLDEGERQLLARLGAGVSNVSVYRTGMYPTAVVFTVPDCSQIKLFATEEVIDSEFEVFPARASAGGVGDAPGMTMDWMVGLPVVRVSILRKSEWIEAADNETKALMLGGSEGATVQHEGKSQDIPAGALSEVSLDAGIEIEFDDGRTLLVATSMFPYALYVSGCDFSESSDAQIYERQSL
ncbi:hypothetical protein [Kordiimonas marina]|uniref:hypothetical protein n=1 Tax=Kordiimonas marina TaxID=2872312 RepID=UPI001FF1B740|nr:hypothetical protein [Kordiimonas marina]MCJ9428225.1 hypothetical protein [Kordiimonas marina]